MEMEMLVRDHYICFLYLKTQQLFWNLLKLRNGFCYWELGNAFLDQHIQPKPLKAFWALTHPSSQDMSFGGEA
jgi:hypothetical protein